MKFSLALFSLLTMTQAFAVSYECTDDQGQKLKIFQEKPDHAVAVLQTALGNKILKGNFVYEDEALYDVTKYDLTASDGQASPITLTKHVVFGRGGCGRAGCDSSTGLASKKAVLTLNGQNLVFNCQ